MNIETALAIIISFVLALIGGTILTSQFNKKLIRYKVIDTAFLSIVMYFVLSRILGLALNANELALAGWNILPVVGDQEVLIWLSQWPWLIFNVFDGNFLFLEVLTAVSLAQLLANLTHKRIGDDREREKYNRISSILSVIVIVPMQLAAWINSYNANISLLLPIISLGISFIAIIFIFLVVRRAWQFNVLILLVQICVIFFLSFYENLPGAISQELVSINVVVPTIIYLALTLFTGLQILTRVSNIKTREIERSPKNQGEIRNSTKSDKFNRRNHNESYATRN